MKMKIVILCLFLCVQVALGEEDINVPKARNLRGVRKAVVVQAEEDADPNDLWIQAAKRTAASAIEERPLPKARNLRSGVRNAAVEEAEEDANANSDPWIQASKGVAAPAKEERPLPKARNLRSGVRSIAVEEAEEDMDVSTDPWIQTSKGVAAPVEEERPLPKARNLRSGVRSTSVKEAEEDMDVSSDPWIQTSNERSAIQEEQPIAKARNMRGLHKRDTGDDDQIEASNDPWIRSSQQRGVDGEAARTTMNHNLYSQQMYEHEQSKEGRTARGQRGQQERAARRAVEEASTVDQAQEAAREETVESAPDQSTNGIPAAAMDHDSYSQQKHEHEQSHEGKTARTLRQQGEAHAARSMVAASIESAASGIQVLLPSKMTHELYLQHKSAHELAHEGKSAREQKKMGFANNKSSYFNPELALKYGLPFAGVFGIALAAAIFIKRRQHQKKIGTYLNMNNYATIPTGAKGRRASKHTINIAPSPVLAAQPTTPSNPSNFEHRFKQTPKLKLRTSQNLTVPNKSSPPDLKLSQTFTL